MTAVSRILKAAYKVCIYKMIVMLEESLFANVLAHPCVK